jgi:hypothetical protein
VAEVVVEAAPVAEVVVEAAPAAEVVVEAVEVVPVAEVVVEAAPAAEVVVEAVEAAPAVEAVEAAPAVEAVEAAPAPVVEAAPVAAPATPEPREDDPQRWKEAAKRLKMTAIRHFNGDHGIVLDALKHLEGVTASTQIHSTRLSEMAEQLDALAQAGQEAMSAQLDAWRGLVA